MRKDAGQAVGEAKAVWQHIFVARDAEFFLEILVAVQNMSDDRLGTGDVDVVFIHARTGREPPASPRAARRGLSASSPRPDRATLAEALESTRDDDPAAIVPNRAGKYREVDGKIVNATMVDMSNRMGAGGFLTNAIDMGKYIEALLAGRLVKPETLKRMMTPARLKDGQQIQ